VITHNTNTKSKLYIDFVSMLAGLFLLIKRGLSSRS
jgi:hypothetical protein